MNTNTLDFYKPIIRTGIKVDCIAGETIPKDEKGTYIQKAFLISTGKGFEIICNNLLGLVLGNNQNELINSLLVVIKKDDTAMIYKQFPITLKMRVKREFKALQAVMKDDIIDIVGVDFSDSIFNVEIDNGDKLIWLFRTNWKFGLYFDFTKTLELKELSCELATCYKQLFFVDLYSFLDNQQQVNDLLTEGWFPFIQLLGSRFQSLMEYYLEEKKYTVQIEKILNFYNEEKINNFSSNWWNNPIFLDKKEIIEAGIDAYFQNTNHGYINAIKTISTEIEGILRLSYFNIFKNKPTIDQIKKHIITLGENKFSSAKSLGFPQLFYEYLDQSVFRGFDLASNVIPPSRHSFAHGIAKLDNYTQIRALQLIFTLDQIYFYLS